MPTPNITRLMRVSFASLFGLLAFAVAQELAYTVQVVALSDRAAAGALQRELLAEGYPVYLVGVPTDEGTVYRLRVGAFGDRGAALAYAEAMRRGGTGAGTGAPVPALAEDVPAGLIPLEPTLLTSYPYLPGVTRLTVVPWGEGYALRFQGAFEGEPLEAEYRVLEGDATPFRAWRAAPFGEGLERVYNFPLWPPDWESLEASGRDAYEENVLATLASSYGLSVNTLKDYRALEPGSGLPYLVRAERRDLATGEGRYYPALGLPQATRDPAGPALRWFDGEAEGFLRGLPEPVFDAGLVLGEEAGGSDTPLPPPETLELSGAGWTASPDDAYTRVRLTPTGRNWRAVAGYPLWAYEDFLLVLEAGQVQLYRFSKRAE